MALYKIVRVYEVPGKDEVEAKNRMAQALELRVERDYHVGDYVKHPEDRKGTGRKIDLTPPPGWLTAFWDQLTGRTGK